MFRSLFRILGMIALALALVAAVLDITRSIADSSVVIRQFGQDWFELSPSTLNLSQAIVQRYVHPLAWDPVIQQILLSPTWLVFGVLAILFLLLGRRRKSRWQQKYGA